MSSTSNSQNLLTNVFRPTYAYDPDKGFIPKLVVSNVDSVVGTSGTFSILNVGDDSNNVYVGINAGNPPTLVSSCNSTAVTALGLNSGSNNSNCDSSVFMGNFAGSNTTNVDNSVYMGALTGNYNSNCANSVYIGYNSATGLCNASNEIAIGANTIAGGSSNVYIGTSTGSSGSSNIFIGPNIAPGNVSNQLRIGSGSNIAVYGDLAAGKLGINIVPTVGFDVSGEAYFNNKVGIQYPNPEHSLDVAGQIYATNGILMGPGSVNVPSIALVDENNTGVFVDSNATDGRSFGFTVRGKKMMTMSDTCLNVFGNLYVEGTFGQGASETSNAILVGYLRAPDIYGATLDISSTGIKTIGDVVAAGNTVHIGNGYITDTSTNGYIRMLTDEDSIRTDISGGNIFTSGNIIASNLGATHRLSGISINNSNISTVSNFNYSGAIVGSTTTATNTIGGVTLSSNNLTYSGRISNTNAAASNVIGGVVLRNSNICNVNDITYTGTITNSLSTTSNSIGGITLSNTRIGVGTSAPVVALEVVGDVSATTYNGPGGTASAPHYTFSDDRTTGVFFPGANMVGLTAGGIERMRISNDKIGIGTTNPSNALDVSGVLRVIGSTGNITIGNGSIDISGTPVVASNGAFSNVSSTSNNIGGVTLSNNNISYSGKITGSTANTSNSIGGVILSNTDISLTGRILGGTTSSNSIGGVTLSNNNISYSGAILNTVSAVQNVIGGVTLFNSRARVGDGSTSFPSISFSNDTASGLNLNNTSSIGLNTAGVQRMCISGTNVGIGTITPTQTLDISGTFRLTNSSNTLFDIIPANGGATITTNGYFSVYKAGTTDKAASNLIVSLSPEGAGGAHYFLSNNVGIGMTKPDHLLDVCSTASGAGIRVTAPNASWKLQDPRNSHTLQGYSDSNGQGLFTSGSRIQISTNSLTGNSGLIVNANQVGIGTVLPTARLDISASPGSSNVLRVANPGTSIGWGGVSQTSLSVDISGGVRILQDACLNSALRDPRNARDTLTLQSTRLQGSNGTASVVFRSATDNNFYGRIYGVDTGAPAGAFLGDLVFQTASGVDLPERMRINSSGNVGIGTSNPSQRLAVQDISGGFFFTAPVGIATNYNRIKSHGTATSNNRDLMFDTNGDVNPTLYLTTTGRVGIGLSNPGHALTVAGNIQLGTINSDYRQLLVGGGNTFGYIYGAYDKFGDGIHMGYNYYASNTTDIIPKTIAGTSRLTTGYGYIAMYTGDVSTAPTKLGYYQDNTGDVGIGTTVPSYKLDVNTDISSSAAINMNTWSRTTNQNTHIIRGIASIATGTGGIVTWSNANVSPISPNLMTPSTTTFVVRKSGIWSVSAIIGTGTNGFAWMDVSTTAATTTTIWTAGTPVIAFGQSGGTIVSLNYTGYLPSNSSNLYAIRTNSSSTNQISNNFLMFTFLYEAPPPSAPVFPGGYPY